MYIILCLFSTVSPLLLAFYSHCYLYITYKAFSPQHNLKYLHFWLPTAIDYNTTVLCCRLSWR